jgi:hypothetical protein
MKLRSPRKAGNTWGCVFLLVEKERGLEWLRN